MPDENGTVEFKGTGQGLAIHVQLLHDSQDLKRLIRQRIEENPGFYQGATLAEITCASLSEESRSELETWLFDEYRMVKNQPKKIIQERPVRKETVEKQEPVDKISQPNVSEGAKFIQGTLRSGQIVEHDGDVVVLGDVNPGAEISAGGNIVVMGSLRGIAHAGLNGDDQSFVAALLLQPTQLRIHQTITRSPDEGNEKSRNPEIAKLKDNIICVEPFLVRMRENE